MYVCIYIYKINYSLQNCLSIFQKIAVGHKACVDTHLFLITPHAHANTHACPTTIHYAQLLLAPAYTHAPVVDMLAT